MNADVLLKHFDRIGDAPDAVPRLRQFVLDLAVRGKLVDHDTADEPAANLLRRIQSERGRFAATEATKILGFEPLPLESIPFSIPPGWTWARLADICSKTGSGSTPRGGKSVYQKNGVPFLRSQNIYDDGLRLDDVAYIDQETHAKMAATAVRPDDLLLNITGGSIGRCCRVPKAFGEANVSQHVAIIRLAISGIWAFAHRLIQSPYFQSFVLGEQTGAGRGGLPKNRMDRIPIVLPPLAEQQRIVAKVDELMALCDRLEEAQKEREHRRDQLTASSVYNLNNGAEGEEAREHARFFVNHLSRFSARPDQIQLLRQMTRHLAVRGKLVPQVRTEEAACEILRRVCIERARLIKDRKLKCDNGIGVSETDIPFAIPIGWQWASSHDLIVFGPQNGMSPMPSVRPDAPKAVTLTATTSGCFDSNHYKQVEANIPKDSDLWLRTGDLLFQRGNTREYVGIAAYYTGESNEFLYPDLMIKVRVSGEMDLRFVHLCVTAPYARRYFSDKASGAQKTMPKINQETLLRLPVPVAPFAEQQRIVERVDRLMCIFDSLEGNLTEARSASGKLLEAVLHESLDLLTPVSPGGELDDRLPTGPAKEGLWEAT